MLSHVSISCPGDHCSAGSGWDPEERWIKVMCTQGQVRRRHRLPRSRQSHTVSKRTGGEKSRWIFTDSSKDSSVVLENVAASVIGGKIKGRGAVLASLANMISIRKEGRRKSYVNTKSPAFFKNITASTSVNSTVFTISAPAARSAFTVAASLLTTAS